MEKSSQMENKPKYIEKTADDLFFNVCHGLNQDDKNLLLINEMPSLNFRKLDLRRFVVRNPNGYTVRNCHVWFPAGYSLHLRPRITFEINGDLDDCNFVFFRVPNKGSRLVWSVFGKGHTTACFSKSRMNLYVRLSERSCHLSIGDSVFIGGARLALKKTTIKIGAGGLWSDGILVQGTDSHGIVDLDTMDIVNDGEYSVTLKRRVWVGRGATIMKNVTIGDGSIVATGALVVKDVPPGCAVGGSPARVVKERVSWTHKQDTIATFDRREMLALRAKLDVDTKLSP